MKKQEKTKENKKKTENKNKIQGIKLIYQKI